MPTPRTLPLLAASMCLSWTASAGAQTVTITRPVSGRSAISIANLARHLSDTPPLWADGSLGPVEIDAHVGGAPAGDGGPLTIGGRVFAKGFGARATSVIAYDLKGQAILFWTHCGIDDSVGSAGTAVFQVVADGEVLFDSGLVRGSDPARFSGRLDVRGVHELLLIATDANDGIAQDRVDWGDPMLLTRSAPNGNGAAFRERRGTWGTVLPWPVQPMHASLLAGGYIVSHASRDPFAAGDPSPGAPHDATRVDRAMVGTWAHTTVDHPSRELFGAGHARRSDGSLVEIGGFEGRLAGNEPLGDAAASRFDAVQDAWIPMPPMSASRYGPGILTLGDGSLLAIAGAHAQGGTGFRPERFDGHGWSTLDGIDTQPYLQTGDASLDRTFPQVHLAPDGRVFQAGWGTRMALFDLTGVGGTDFVSTREPIQRAWGTSTSTLPNVITMVGGVDHGGSPGTAERTALRIVIDTPTPVIVPTSPMLFRRSDHDATVLADGSLLVTGGAAEHTEGSNPTAVQIGELFDVRTNRWSLVAPTSRPRGYRSTALLLPDGRVWTGGGDPTSATAEVFTPPYLYASNGQLASRPVIQGAPAQVAWNQTFSISVSGAVARTTLVRTGSATHGVNSDQRFLELAFTQSGNTVSATAPDRGYDAPPGDYMLFVIDTAGVPSPARFLRIGAPRPNVWTTVFSSDGSFPEPRHETAMTAIGGKLYLFGGRGMKPTQEYDPVARTWRSLGPPPFEIHHFQPIVYGNKAYVVGAFTGGYPNESNVSSIWIFDPRTNTWSQGPVLPPGRERGSAGAVLYDGKFYLIGGNNQGHNGGARPWFDVFDPVTRTWSQLPDAPRARDHFLAAVVGNRMVVAGGRQTTQPNPFTGTIREVDVYDFTAGTWSTLTDGLPTERAGTMAVAFGRHVVVAGGESTSPNTAHDEVEALDVFAETWTALPDLVRARHSGGVAEVDGRMFIVSGSGNAGGGPELDSVEVISLPEVLTADNLLANGGFDDAFASWSAGPATLVAEGGATAPGARIGGGSLTQTTTVPGAGDYSLRLLYTATASSGAVTARVEFLNGGSVVGTTSRALAPATAVSSVDLAATAPSSATRARVTITATGSRAAVVDDVTLVRD